MEKQQFHDTLEKLHAELASVQTVDQDERELLQNLMHDIQNVMKRSGEPSPQVARSLGEQLHIKLDTFEGTHPQLTSVIAQISYILSQMGI